MLADAEIADLRQATRLFEDVAGLRAVNGDLTTRDGDLPMERVSAASATDNLLPMLGVRPAFGRFLDDRIDSAPGRVLSVVISHELWVRRYGADPQLVGRFVEINNMSLAVVGILPQGFRLHFGSDTNVPSRVDVWFPTGLSEERRYRSHTTVGRLASGVTLDQAQAELTAIATRVTAANPDIYGRQALRLHADHLQADAAREAAPVLVVLLCAVAFVLLIACANVGHLLLTRTIARGRELAIRSAVGAARPRLVRQLLTEGAMPGIAGGAAGFLLALWGEWLLSRLRPATLPPVDPTVDGRVLIFAVGITIAASLLFSIAPALQAFRGDVVDALKAGGRGAVPRSRRIRIALIVSEVALTVVLLAAAGLMIQTVAALRAVDTGFDDRGLVTMRAGFSPRDFREGEKRWAFLPSGDRASARVAGCVEAVFSSRARRMTGLLAASRASHVDPISQALDTTNFLHGRCAAVCGPRLTMCRHQSGGRLRCDAQVLRGTVDAFQDVHESRVNALDIERAVRDTLEQSALGRHLSAQGRSLPPTYYGS